MNKQIIFGTIFLLLVVSVIAVNNDVADLNLDYALPSINNVADLELGTGTALLCSGSSDCVISCGTNISSNIDVGGYNITFSGAGKSYVTANITGYQKFDVIGNLIGGNSCYQESANTSNQGGIDGNCVLNYGGIYASDFSRLEWIDGDWSTFNSGGTNTFITMNVTYLKPVNVIDGVWSVKDGVGQTNITIPTNCFNYSTSYINLSYQSMLNSTSLTAFMNWKCYNGTGYQVLRNVTSALTSNIFEEGMIWNTLKGYNSCTVVLDKSGLFGK